MECMQWLSGCPLLHVQMRTSFWQNSCCQDRKVPTLPSEIIEDKLISWTARVSSHLLHSQRRSWTFDACTTETWLVYFALRLPLLNAHICACGIFKIFSPHVCPIFHPLTQLQCFFFSSSTDSCTASATDHLCKAEAARTEDVMYYIGWQTENIWISWNPEHAPTSPHEEMFSPYAVDIKPACSEPGQRFWS